MKNRTNTAVKSHTNTTTQIPSPTQPDGKPQLDQAAVGSTPTVEPPSGTLKPKARRGGQTTRAVRQPIEEPPVDLPIIEPAPAVSEAVQPQARLTELPVDEIDINLGIQCRVRHCDKTIAEFAEQMLAGAKFPPITVYEVEGCRVLTDGHHRLLAARKAGLNSISAKIWTGSHRDALRSSIGVNAKHKLNFNNKDKRKAVTMSLAELQSELSHRDIAKLCCVSPGLVDKIALEQKKVPTEGNTSTDAGAQASPGNGKEVVEPPREGADSEAAAEDSAESSNPASEQPADEAQEAASATKRNPKHSPDVKSEAKLLARIKKATPEICGEIALLLFTLGAKVDSKEELRGAFNKWLTDQVTEN